jgi:hypothetical protein
VPTYRITDPKTGRTLKVTGDSPPTESELEGLFAAASGQTRTDAPITVERPGPKPQTRDALSRMLDLLPTAGGIGGGIVGGVGGTAFGMGFGGVPGAVGGATLGGGSMEALRQAIEEFRGVERPDGSLDAAKQIATQGAIQGGSELVGAGIAKGASAGARAVYRGYLKPSLATRELPKAPQIVETALKEALPITRSGESTAQRLIADLRAQVDDVLARTPGKADLKAIADRVRSFARKRYFRPGKPNEDYEAALRVADAIDAHPSLPRRPGPTVTREVDSAILDASGRPMRVTETVPGPPVVDTKVSLPGLNKVKQGLDEAIGEANFGVERGATKTTQKVGRHAARRTIEAQAPSVGPLNARESKLIDAAKAIAKAVEREANQNKLYGVKTIAAGAYGGNRYMQGDSPVEAALKGLAARGLLQAGPQSKFAILANRFSRELGVTAASAARLAAYVLQGESQ